MTVANWNIKTTLHPTRRGVSNATTANSSGAAVDLLGYINPGGRALKGLLSVGAVTSTGHLAVRFQESSTSGESGFADISGAAFTATGDTATTGSEEIVFRASKRYVRAIGAASDTANIDYAVYVLAEKCLT